MCEGVPVAVYLQGLSLLIGLIAVIIPVVIALVGVYVSRRLSDRMDNLGIVLDDALSRIKDMEQEVQKKSGPGVVGEQN